MLCPSTLRRVPNRSRFSAHGFCLTRLPPIRAMLARMGFLTEVTGPPVTEAPSAQWIFDQIENWAARSPEKIAFVTDHEDRVEKYTYVDVIEQAAAIAAGLKQRGIARGDRVGILMENIPQWVFVLLGCMRAGAI